MAGTYDLKRAAGDKFMWNLKAGNHQVILTSEMYNSKEGAKIGIASCKANSGLEARYERKNSKRGEPYFVLKAANAEIIGASEMYTSATAMEAGIASCKANGPNGEVKDLT